MAKKQKKDISRRDFLKTATGAVGAVTIGGALIGPRKAAAAEPIKVGLINPLEGECAQWGIPIVRGGQLWADEHNANGGILCGDGQRHPIEYDAYTNVCYYPNEELKAAKKAILEDGKRFMFQTYTPACRRAVAPLCTQKKVLISSYGCGFISPTYPYTMGGITGTPTSNLAHTAFMLEKNPEIKRVAIACTDDSYGHAHAAYYAAACAAYKDRVKVVFDEVFDPKLTEYFSLMGSVLKNKPDAILHCCVTPGKQAILLETGYHLGFDGFWAAETWDLPHILKKVSPEQMEGRIYSGFTVDASVPGFSKRMENMYTTYCDKWGAQEFIVFVGATYASLCTFDVGLQAAKSIDSTDVMNTLYSMAEVDHPIFGKSRWSGMEIYGTNHHLLTGSPIYVVEGGKHTYGGTFYLGPWWAKYKDVALPVLKERGQTYV